MLEGKGDSDDRDCQGEGESEVSQAEVPTCEDEPKDIAEEPERAGTDVAFAGEGFAVDDGASEGPEGEGADHETGPAPRNADDADGHEGPDEIPVEAGEAAAENNPKKIEQESHVGLEAFVWHDNGNLKAKVILKSVYQLRFKPIETLPCEVLRTRPNFKCTLACAE